MWFIVVNSLCVVLRRMKGRKDRPEETFRVGVFHVYSTFFLAQLLMCGNISRPMQRPILRNTEHELCDTIKNKTTAANVPVVGLR